MNHARTRRSREPLRKFLRQYYPATAIDDKTTSELARMARNVGGRDDPLIERYIHVAQDAEARQRENRGALARDAEADIIADLKGIDADLLKLAELTGGHLDTLYAMFHPVVEKGRPLNATLYG